MIGTIIGRKSFFGYLIRRGSELQNRECKITGVNFFSVLNDVLRGVLKGVFLLRREEKENPSAPGMMRRDR